MMDNLRVRVYAGTELIEEVNISYVELYHNVKPGYDMMQYIETKLSVVIPDTKSMQFALRRMTEQRGTGPSGSPNK